MDSKDSPNSILNLAFGVELEFLLAYVPQKIPSSLMKLKEQGENIDGLLAQYEYAEKEFQRSRVREGLIEAGLDVNDGGLKDYKKWNVHRDGSVVPTEKELTAEHYLWANGQQINLAGKQEMNIRYVDVEIISPILTYSGDAFSEIEKVIDAIRRRFPVVTPSTSGFHVHVGNESKGFPLQTLKNLTILTHCFESQINQIHPAHRLECTYCLLPQLAFDPRDRDPLRMAEIINEQKDTSSFLDFFCTERNCRGMPNNYRSYNFGNLGIGMSKQTVEFRQHKGTLNMAEIRNWIITTNSLVGLSHTSSPAAIADLVLSHGYNTNFSLVDLFCVLGLPRLASYYGPYLHDHSRVIIPDLLARNVQDDFLDRDGERLEIESNLERSWWI